MIERVIEFCAKNRFIVFAVVGFATLWGVWSLSQTPLDALPDLSDVQVIVFSEWMGRSPDLVEDQVTYPIITRMISAPGVRTVRGISMFGMSFIYVIFEDGTDIYWARSRVMEYLSGAASKLPEGVKPVLGPDATGVGWVFEYALVDESGKSDLSELRSFQDWTLKSYLESVPGVAEVASIGGFVKEYQVNVDPDALLAYNVPLEAVVNAVRRNNNDAGGRVVEFSSTEYFVRGRGYLTSTADIENLAVGASSDGTPVLVRNIATVTTGPAIRRGLAEYNGIGETVGGIVVMRQGENALDVIERVRQKLHDIAPSLPAGTRIVTTYDRSDLIRRAIAVLEETLAQEMIIISIIVIVFLLHVRSALVPIVTLPIAVILSFIPMHYMGISSNIMSLGGIAIAIGEMVDASIVLTENVHKRLENGALLSPLERDRTVIEALKEVGSPIFYSLLVLTVSFLPIFALQAQEGRLFKPLAFTKTFSMFFGAILAITLAPPLVMMLVRGRIRSEEEHPISRFLHRLYHPVITVVLRHTRAIVAAAVILLVSTIPVYFLLGSEFMPPLNEGTILFMPTSVPGMSVAEASSVLQIQDRLLKEFPEVETVFGKAGRAETSTDPAPLNMMETVVTLKPESEWREGVTWDSLLSEMDDRLKLPGMANIWWMPVQTRTEMLTTGLRSNLGVKVFGPDLDTIESIGIEIEKLLKTLPGTRSAFAERISGGYYLDVRTRRADAARYGLSVDDVHMAVEVAIGGDRVTSTIEGKERYGVSVRYPRELRDDPERIRGILLSTPAGAQIPLGEVADVEFAAGPPMITNEGGSRLGYVLVDVSGKSIGDYISGARDLVREKIDLPPGYFLEWGGQFEHMERMKRYLYLIIPVTVFLVFLLIYMNTRSTGKTFFVLLAVPFSLIGAFWYLWILGYNLSVAVWVGIIALAGLDAETGIMMLLYLDLAWDERKRAGRLRSVEDLKEVVHIGAVKRIRPKLMTMFTTVIGLLPIMWSTGTGADVMKRIAAPMVGGITTSVAMELVLYPAIFFMLRKKMLPAENQNSAPAA